MSDLPYPDEPERTHWEGCYRSPKHHNCAVVEVDRLTARLAEVEAENERLREKFEAERRWRHTYGSTCREWLVDEGRCCKDCFGSGYKTYGTTATWRGGVGGATPTSDVCNKCWGSGDTTRPWSSHRAALAQPKEPEHD